jgi:hypothetical protein
MAVTTMTDGELVRAIEMLESAADDGELAEERIKALEAYRGENTNPAPEGRSQVVDRSVYDVTEAVMGPILKLFLSGEDVVQFTPRGPEDIAAADQESSYVNYILTEKNDAFNILGGWLHDALIQKNGYVIARWQDETDAQKETYKSLTDDEFQMLMSAGDVQILEHAEALDEMTGYRTHSVKIERTSSYGCVKVENIAPENVLVDPNLTTVNLKDAAFVCRREEMTISALRGMGFEVEDDINDGGSSREDWEFEVRREQSWREDTEDNEPDPSMRRIKVREVWLRTDFDGDGEAELRHVVVVGTTILHNEEAEFIPVVAFSSKPLPHQHYGESFYDELKEVQAVKTALLRGVLDNLYLANNGRFAINADRVNLDDMLVSRPGGVVRVDGDPMGAMMPLVQPSNPGPALQALEYMDIVRETRTGVTRVGTGLDPNSLNKTATGIMALQGAQSQRIELIARYFAESVKELCLLVHALTLKHSRQAEIVMLRGEWVPVDPRQWTRRKDMSISVGLGTGNRQEQSMFLQGMLQLALGPALQLGLTNPSLIFSMLGKMANIAGYKNAEEFWQDPAKQPQMPPQPPAPDPQMVALQQQAQLEQAKLQMTMQAKQAEMQAENQLEQQKAVVEAELERERAKLQAAVALKKARIDAEAKVKVAKYQAAASQTRTAVSRLLNLPRSRNVQ